MIPQILFAVGFGAVFGVVSVVGEFLHHSDGKVRVKDCVVHAITLFLIVVAIGLGIATTSQDPFPAFIAGFVLSGGSLLSTRVALKRLSGVKTEIEAT